MINKIHILPGFYHMAAPEEAKAPEGKMHVKDARKEKMDRIRLAVERSVRRQVIMLASHELPKLQDPSTHGDSGPFLGQGKREIERRRRRIREGKIKEANGLVRQR